MVVADRFLGVSPAKQARYLALASLRAYRAPGVDLLIQYLVQDEPDPGRWQSGLVTAGGVRKPSYAVFELPLAVERRTRATVTLWGQIRPGLGRQPYVLEELRAGAWRRLGGPARTGVRGTFVRTVAAVTGTRFRVVQLSRDLTSATLTS